jgi:hypothetical protein
VSRQLALAAAAREIPRKPPLNVTFEGARSQIARFSRRMAFVAAAALAPILVGEEVGWMAVLQQVHRAVM